MENIKIITNLCMQTDKPQVSILLAVYEPNLTWLREQLKSLNEQRYPNLKLYIREDKSPTVKNQEILTCIKECITNFNYEYEQNTENIGSNLTFQHLTQEAEGDYFAYCDQDDIWLPDKVSMMLEPFQKDKVSLVCSDLYMMDEKGNVLADSITKMRKRHIFYSGADVSKYLVVSNFVTGCAMMVRSEIAKKALPFEPLLVHDHWLAIVASLEGEIVCLSEPLVEYRQHSGNQTGVLSGVMDKETYYHLRICHYQKTAEQLQMRLKQMFPQKDSYSSSLQEYLLWLEGRELFYRKHQIKSLKTMVQYQKFGRHTVLLEAFLPILPNFLFSWVIEQAKRGKL